MKRRPRKGEKYPDVGDVVSLVVGEGVRCAGVALALNPPAIATSFLKYTFPDGEEPDFGKISPDDVLDTKMHGPLGFNESWLIHGPLPGFRRADWPPLIFYQHYLKRAVWYDEETLDFNTAKVVEAGENVNGWLEDGPAGHGYVENVLAKELVKLGVLK